MNFDHLVEYSSGKGFVRNFHETSGNVMNTLNTTQSLVDNVNSVVEKYLAFVEEKTTIQLIVNGQRSETENYYHAENYNHDEIMEGLFWYFQKHPECIMDSLHLFKTTYSSVFECMSSKMYFTDDQTGNQFTLSVVGGEVQAKAGTDNVFNITPYPKRIRHFVLSMPFCSTWLAPFIFLFPNVLTDAKRKTLHTLDAFLRTTYDRFVKETRTIMYAPRTFSKLLDTDPEIWNNAGLTEEIKQVMRKSNTMQEKFGNRIPKPLLIQLAIENGDEWILDLNNILYFPQKEEIRCSLTHLAETVHSISSQTRLLKSLYFSQCNFLLHGEPGCGKTTFVGWIAQILKMRVVSVSLNCIPNKQSLRSLIEQNVNSIIFFDDIDHMQNDLLSVDGPPRESVENVFRKCKMDLVETNNAIAERLTRADFLHLLNGSFSDHKTDGMTVIVLACNDITKIHPAVIRDGRFTFKIQMSRLSVDDFMNSLLARLDLTRFPESICMEENFLQHFT